MKTLTINEAQWVSGGCPTCMVIPGACIAAGVVTTGAAYFGWGHIIGYTAGAAFSIVGAYLLYQKMEEKELNTLS